jgi:hypothetical protein
VAELMTYGGQAAGRFGLVQHIYKAAVASVRSPGPNGRVPVMQAPATVCVFMHHADDAVTWRMHAVRRGARRLAFAML